MHFADVKKSKVEMLQHEMLQILLLPFRQGKIPALSHLNVAVWPFVFGTFLTLLFSL